MAQTLGVLPRRGAAPVVPASGEMERIHAALATAAHELRGPATVLLAMSELLSTERGSLDEETFNQMLDAIARQAHVLDRVTGDLLAATQSQRGELLVEVEPTQVLPILASTAISVADLGSLGLDCAADVWVLGDPIRLQQMLGNLVANAFKYGAAPVEIAVHRDGRRGTDLRHRPRSRCARGVPGAAVRAVLAGARCPGEGPRTGALSGELARSGPGWPGRVRQLARGRIAVQHRAAVRTVSAA